MSSVQMSSPTAQSCMSGVQELTRKVNEALTRNDHATAYAHLEEMAALPEVPTRSLVVAGILAVERNDPDQARRFFTQALAKSEQDFDARYNLALVDLSTGHVSEALAAFRRLVRSFPERTELLADLGVVYMEQQRVRRALACFRMGLRRDPNLRAARDGYLECLIANNLIDDARRLLDWNDRASGVTIATRAELAIWRERLAGEKQSPEQSRVEVTQAVLPERLEGHKLAFFASHPSFVRGIMAELEKRNDVRLFEKGSAEDLKRLMKWADLAWFEWCDDLVVHASHLPKHCPVVCRLHSYEAFTDMPSRVDWTKVDRLLFVSEAVRHLVSPQLRDRVSTSVITNGVDLDRFVIPPQKTRTKRIASVGYINYKKNTPLLLYCFKKIHEYDPQYSLHIAGEHQDPRIQLYVDNFLLRHPLPVHFEGWIEDMPAWYADKDFVISTSLFESFHYSIAEGMATGVMPLVHDWYGADGVYPQQYLFGDPDDCLALLRRLEAGDSAKWAMQNREFIRTHYNQTDKLQQIERMLIDLARASNHD
jgi:Flp pilus assembly protein TadD